MPSCAMLTRMGAAGAVVAVGATTTPTVVVSSSSVPAPTVTVPTPNPAVATAQPTATTPAATSVAAGMPSGVVTGNLLLALISQRNTTAVFTPPTGWTAVGAGSTAGSSTTFWFWKVSDGTEGSTQTWSSTQSALWTTSVLRITNAATTSPVDASNYNTVTASTSPAVTGLTTTGTNRLVIAAITAGSTTGNPYSPPAGWAEHTDHVNGTSTAQTTASLLFASAGATGSATFTASASVGGAGAIIAIKPAP